jgi:hypothetical protein
MGCRCQGEHKVPSTTICINCGWLGWKSYDWNFEYEPGDAVWLAEIATVFNRYVNQGI